MAKPIDRKALVTRHNVHLASMNLERPLQVGNGQFAFGMDATGLQTFAPFNTMSDWGWNSVPVPAGMKVSDYTRPQVLTHGRLVPYPLYDHAHPEISQWLAANPHKVNLGRVGLILKFADGRRAVADDISKLDQTLDMWSGVVTSKFEFDGSPVTVKTVCDPSHDAIGVTIESKLVSERRISAFVASPADNGNQFDNFVGDWSNPGKFALVGASTNSVELARKLNDLEYRVSVRWSGSATCTDNLNSRSTLEIVKAEYGAQDKWLDITELAKSRTKDGRLVLTANNDLGPEPIHGVVKSLKVTYKIDGRVSTAEATENQNVIIDTQLDRNRFVLTPAKDQHELAFTVQFSEKTSSEHLDPKVVFDASSKHWSAYWKSGGAIDLSESKDTRWFELERRIVLSQYLMAINEAGSHPPQESGLVNNGWFGKWHMEMVWWHEAHWALWNRWDQLNKSIGIYKKLLPKAQVLAKSQGYKGARWPKCVGPDLVEWPHEIHSYLGWQQPHPIFFAELDYRKHPTKETLEKWRPIVEATADFLASYAFYDKDTKRYVLGPPMHLVSENTDPYNTQNPTFELSYWRFGLRMANEWRKRLKLSENAEWKKVHDELAPLPQQEGLYVLHERVQDMWTKNNFEHPAITGVYGLLPGDGVDKAVMKPTLEKISQVWNWERTWGWDFPMLAMCAARLGEPERALDFLLTKAGGFQFDERGLATGGPFPYFPSNGGLLYAIAMMAEGWEGSKGDAPGFPKNGQWVVKSEGLNKAL